MAKIVSPSLLSADFTNLQKDIDLVNRSEADWLHIDVMDGVFVPNLTFGFPVIAQLRKICKKPFDVHLMIERPERYVERFKEVGADILTIHIEACIHLHRTLEHIKELGMKAGVALNPHTPLSAVEEILDVADMILVMSVNPGFGKQKIIDSTFEKTRRLKDMIVAKRCDTIIQVDGGVNLENASALVEAGVDCLVAGTAVYGSDNPDEVVSVLKKA